MHQIGAVGHFQGRYGHARKIPAQIRFSQGGQRHTPARNCQVNVLMSTPYDAAAAAPTGYA